MDELVDVERLRDLLRTHTGKGVKVAILDTGVDTDHPAIGNAVRGCFEVVRGRSGFVCQPMTSKDSAGHGTACAGIINGLAPDAELYSVRVLGRNAAGTGEHLIQGLKWAIDEGMDVVNLSLGTMQRQFYVGLHEQVNRAYSAGTILVAAANNQGLPSLPAAFSSLIAVDNESLPDPLTFYYQLGTSIELVADGIYVRAPSPGGGYQYYTGTSFACPRITGLVARLKEAIPDLRPPLIKTVLWCLRANRTDVG